MSYSQMIDRVPVEALLKVMQHASPDSVQAVLSRGRAVDLEDFAKLISPAADGSLEGQASLAHDLTAKHFGKVIRLFAPLYLSNECINTCKYCGFSMRNRIPRITLPVSQVVDETQKLARQGFRSLLLVAGEHPRHVSNGYVEECIRECLGLMPSIALEVGPMETEGYLPLVQAGCEGLIVYQETYHRECYRGLHTAGPKKNYDWRVDTPERAYDAGFRRIGIGALLGLYDWRYEALMLAAHAQYLTRRCWKAQLSISFPRMRPAAGGFQVDPANVIRDREMVRLVTAFRLLLPHASLVLSTRESPGFRDGMMRLGITQMSAGSSTEPGGYSSFDETVWKPSEASGGEQFAIADPRSPAEVAAMIRRSGYDPVWKDFDQSLVA